MLKRKKKVLEKKISYPKFFFIILIFILGILFLLSKYSARQTQFSASVLGTNKQLALGDLEERADDYSDDQGEEINSEAADIQYEGSEIGGNSGVSDDGDGTGSPNSVSTCGGDGVCCNEDKSYCCDRTGRCWGEVRVETTEPGVEDDNTIEDEDLEVLDIDESEWDKLFGETIVANVEKIQELAKDFEEIDLSVTTIGDSLAIVDESVVAIIDIPLTIDPKTEAIIVKTDDGIKKINVLPDKALESVLSEKELSRIDESEDVVAIPRDNKTITKAVAQIETKELVVEPEPTSAQYVKELEVPTTTRVINLTVRNNDPVYEIKGVKENKVFGFIPVETKSTVYVSAEKGNIVAKKQSVFASAIRFLSPK